MSTTESDTRRDIIRAIPPAVLFRDEQDDAGDGDTRPVLYGHFARFNEWTEIDSWFEGRFMEQIAPGAFKKTFRERRDELRVLFQHGRDPMVGDKPIAEIEDLREDDEGGYHESRLLDGVPDLIVSGLRAGQYGQSFRMEVLREEIKDEPDASDSNPHGLPERTIKEIRLHEFGPVTFPAYSNTTPQMRSLTDRFIFDWIERNPDHARTLVRAVDLSSAAFDDTSTRNATITDNAPSAADAALTGTSLDMERRDKPTVRPVRQWLSNSEPRPTWAL